MIQRLGGYALSALFLLEQHELGCFVQEQAKSQQVISEVAAARFPLAGLLVVVAFFDLGAVTDDCLVVTFELRLLDRDAQCTGSVLLDGFVP